VTMALVAVSALAGLAALLAVPTDLRFHVASGAPPRLRLEWLFGWFGRNLARPASRPSPPRRLGWLRALIDAWNADLQARAMLLLRRLSRALRVRELRVHARFGLSDPAETGRAWGVVAPLLAQAARSWPTVDLRVEPDFLEVGFAGEARGTLRVWPLRVLPPLVAFGASAPVRRALLRLRAARAARAATA
jgi:hypothetical protein